MSQSLDPLNSYRVVLAVILLLALPGLASAQKEKESDIVAKFRVALLRCAEDGPEPPIIMKGKAVADPMTMNLQAYYQKPNNRVEMSMAGMSFISFNNDTVRWTYNSVTKSHSVEKISGSASKSENEKQKRFDFASKDLLNYKARGHKLQSMGTQQTDSIETQALMLTLKDKTLITILLHRKTNLMYMIQIGEDYRIYSNYRRFGEYVYPTFIRHYDEGKKLDMILEDVQIDAPIPSDKFVIPKEAYASIKSNDDQLEAAIKHADELYEEGKFEQASGEYATILKNFGKVYRAFNGRGLCYIQAEKYYEAISDFNAALEISPNTAIGLNNRGLAKYYLGDMRGATADYDAAIAADSTMTTAITGRALIYFNDEKYDEAAAQYRRVVRLTPDNGESHYNYGIALAMLEQYEDALASYKKSISLGHGPVDLYNRVGVAYYKLENYDSAAALFKKAMAMDKDEIQYLENYANALYYQGKYKESEKQFEHLISLKADDAEAHNMLGLLDEGR